MVCFAPEQKALHAIRKSHGEVMRNEMQESNDDFSLLSFA